MTSNTASTPSHNTAETTSGVKAATKTTEFFVYAAMVLATVITSLVVGDNGENTEDAFNAAQAMQYITYLTIGYMVARGLAKSGNRHATHG